MFRASRAEYIWEWDGSFELSDWEPEIKSEAIQTVAKWSEWIRKLVFV